MVKALSIDVRKINDHAKTRSPALHFFQFLILTVILLFYVSRANSKTFREEDLFERSPVFQIKTILKEEKKQESYYFDRSIEYFKMKEFELSIEKLQQLLNAYPETDYKEKASFLMVDNEFYKALKDKKSDLLPVISSYQKAIADYPGSKYVPWAHLQIANCYNRMERKDEANTKYEEFLEKYRESEYIESASIFLAELYYYTSRYKQTIEKLSEFLKNYPDSKYKQIANYFIAFSYYKLNEKERSFEYFDQVKGIEKEYPDETLYYAKILIERKMYKEAIYNLAYIINHFPSFSDTEDEKIKETLFSVGKSLIDLKVYSLALEVFERMRVGDKPYKSEDVLYQCVYAAYYSKNYDIFKECSDKLLENYKKSGYIEKIEYFNAKIEHDLKRYESATKLLEEYIEKRGEKKDDFEKIVVYSDIADSYDKLGNEKQAVSYYKKISNIAKKFSAEEKYAELYEKSVMKIAGLSYVLKDYSEAIKHYEIYFKNKKGLKPDDNVHLFYLAKSYQNEEDLESAHSNYNKLIKNNGRDFYVKAAKEEVKNIEFLKSCEDYL